MNPRRGISDRSRRPGGVPVGPRRQWKMKGIAMKRDRGRLTFRLAGAAGLIAGIALTTVWQNAVSAQPANARRVIRPAKAPNTGLPFSPGILAGNTLYISGHLGR